MLKKCRIWWPQELSLPETPISESLLFGWFLSPSSSSDSIDVVVAFSWSTDSLSDSRLGLEETTHRTNEKMPVSLQDKSAFSLLGRCSTNSINGQLSRVGIEEEDDESKSSTSGKDDALHSRDIFEENFGGGIYECIKHDGLRDPNRKNSTGNNWIQLVWHSRETYGRKMFWIPKLHQICWNGKIVLMCDVHFVLYVIPTYGSHHFSLQIGNSFEQEKAPLRNPKWVEDLHQKQTLCDMDVIIQAINCSTAAKMLFQTHSYSKMVFVWVSPFIWHLFSISVASLSTVLYIILQSLYKLLSFASSSLVYTVSTKVFNMVALNIQIRCSQFLYWPIILQDRGIRLLSCVEYKEKAAFRRHFMWSGLVADVLFGNLIGFALLCHAESVSLWVLNFVDEITNELLRSGCVWLMGIPAGFKLNTELAGAIGMLSLNAIQIWSTLWVFVGSHFVFFVKALAILGIIFGATLPAAFIIDFIALGTLHVSTIQCIISVLYSTQIQAIASLWRLFRGQKWNPLRHRLDSYDYTVKQHVVGSLLFAPLLLLLPTTSVFYIFFSILGTTINLICMFIGVVISVIHATPYAKILLWLEKRRRFPSGIWFDIVSYWENGSADDPSNTINEDTCKENSSMVSFLHTNFMTLRQVVSPHYRTIFSGISRSSIASSAYGVLTGKRMGSTFVTSLPSPMPWMSIPCKEYWYLCHDSIMECRQ